MPAEFTTEIQQDTLALQVEPVGRHSISIHANLLVSVEQGHAWVSLHHIPRLYPELEVRSLFPHSHSGSRLRNDVKELERDSEDCLVCSS